MEIRDFLLERYYGRWEFAVTLQLGASDCEPLTAARVLELAGIDAGELLDLRLGYTENFGHPQLREQIARHYPGRTPDDVLVCNAPQEAILLGMHALLQAGDTVVVMSPCYQSLKEVARSIGCEVLEWRLVEREGSWRMDLEGLPALLDGARLLVTNAPHNPTGLQPTPDEWRAVREAARDSGARWFSDEMYRGLEWADAGALPPAASEMEGAVSLWGMSKSFGLAGLRIGWVVSSDRGLLDAMSRLKDYTSICSSAPGELLARAALSVSEKITAGNRARIADNAARMRDFATRHGDQIEWQPPMAGPVSLARIPSGTADAHAARVREHGALLVPSHLFDLEDRWLRVGLGRADFAQALDCWEKALSPGRGGSPRA